MHSMSSSLSFVSVQRSSYFDVTILVSAAVSAATHHHTGRYGWEVFPYICQEICACLVTNGCPTFTRSSFDVLFVSCTKNCINIPASTLAESEQHTDPISWRVVRITWKTQEALPQTSTMVGYTDRWCKRCCKWLSCNATIYLNQIPNLPGVINNEGMHILCIKHTWKCDAS